MLNIDNRLIVYLRNLRSRLRERALRYCFLETAFVIFFSSIMFLDLDRPNGGYFDKEYYLVLIAFFLTFTGPEILSLARSKVLLASSSFLFFLWLTPVWTGGMNTWDWIDLGRRSIEVHLFTMAVASLFVYESRHLRLLPIVMATVAGGTALFSIARFLVEYSGQIYGNRLATFPWPNENTGPAMYGLMIAGLIFYAWENVNRQQVPFRRDRSHLVLNFISNNRHRFYFTLVSLILLVDILFASTRTVLVALSISGVVFGAVAFSKLSSRQKMRSLFVILVLCVLASLVFLETDIHKNLFRGYSMRDELLVGFWKIAVQHFWIGHGMQNEFKYLVNGIAAPHNQLLTALLYGGVFATLLLFALYVAMMIAGIELYRKSGAFALISIVIFVIVHGFFETVIFAQSPDWRWLFLWVPVGMAGGVELRFRRSPG